MGQREESIALHRKVLEGRRKVLAGSAIVDVYRSMHNLASVLGKAGYTAEAEKMYREALEGKRKSFGYNHPSTLSTANHLTALLRDEPAVTWSVEAAAEPQKPCSALIIAARRCVGGGGVGFKSVDCEAYRW